MVTGKRGDGYQSFPTARLRQDHFYYYYYYYYVYSGCHRDRTTPRPCDYTSLK